MSDADRRPSHEREPERELAPAERLLRERVEGLPGIGRPLTERARIAQRSVESYLLGANNPPRWMERVAEIDRALKRERQPAAGGVADAASASTGRTATGSRRRGARFAASAAESREYRELNELIRAHNEWYPVERNLPVNPRTGEWVTVGGRSFLRPVVGTAWVLREFPAEV